jgi:hypothetical protein
MLKKTAQMLEEILAYNSIHIEIREVNIEYPSTKYAFEILNKKSIRDIKALRKDIILSLNLPIKRIRICSTKKGFYSIYIPNLLIN